MKIWLDDVRDAPDDSWEVVRDFSSVILELEYGGVEAISLDHDLGGDIPPGMTRAWTGYDVALRIEEMVAEDCNYYPPKIYVHTDNPVGRANIWEAIKSINRMMIDRYNDWSEPR